MNERCREALYHSWGKAPERKKLEREYNRSYYQKNKQKWGVKSAKDAQPSLPIHDEDFVMHPGPYYTPVFIGPRPDEKPKPPTAGDYALTGMGYAAMLVPGGAYLFESPKQFTEYLKEDISIAKRFVMKIEDVGKDVARASKKAIAAGKKFVENLNVVKKWKRFMKEGQDYIDQYY